MIDLKKKEYNTYLLLNLINSYGPISRTQLCEITELRAATISEITKELLDKELIKSEGSTNSGRGRNQILLTVNDDYLCAIGVSIEVTDITFIVSSIRGKILKKVVKKLTSLTTASQISDMIIDVLKEIVEEFKDKKILGIGVGDPGLVDATGEYSVFSSQFKLWVNIPLKHLLEKALNLPVKLEVNDRLKALGEKTYGLARNIDDLVCVFLGEGIGISIISNGNLIRGYTGTAGEMGHTKVAHNNKMCICGSYNCLETIASMNAILSQVKEAVADGALTKLRELASDINDITFADIINAVEANDKLCRNIVENAGSYIGTALSNVVNIINPQLIIFEGPMSELGDVLLNSIKANVFKDSLYLATNDLDFKVSELKNTSAPLGAVTMIMNEFFMTEYFNKLYPKIFDKRDKEAPGFFRVSP